MQIRNEIPSDAAAIESVTIAAFRQAEHTSHTEQFIVRALRHSGQLVVSIVAEDGGSVVGHVAVSPVTVSGVASAWYGLGPISVLPAWQRRGIGTLLVEHALERLRALGAAGCVVLGEPGYYGRFGFNAVASLALAGVPPQYFQAISFGGHMPTGTVKYHDSFEATASQVIAADHHSAVRAGGSLIQVLDFTGGNMLKLAIATVALCLASGISNAATPGEDQAGSFMRLYSSLCLKHVNNLEALRNKLRPMPKLPPEKAEHFLAGRAGEVWPISDKHGTFVLALLDDKDFCAVYGRRADTEAVEQRFSAIAAAAPPPLVAKQVENVRAQTSANGETHTVAYEWSVSNFRRKMLFTLTTASSASAQIQVLGSAAIISQ